MQSCYEYDTKKSCTWTKQFFVTVFFLLIWRESINPWCNNLNVFNSSPPSAAYMPQWIGSALVQIMAYRLFGAKPFSKPMMDYCKLDPLEQPSVDFSPKTQNFSFTTLHLKISSEKCRPFYPGGHELNFAEYARCVWLHVSECVLPSFAVKKGPPSWVGVP